MKFFLKIIFIIAVVVLTSCNREKFEQVPTNISVIASVNIKDMSLSFIDMKKQKKVAEWKMKQPYVGGMLLPDGDTLLLYGKMVETVDLYSLKKGEKLSSWKTGKGIVNGRLLSNHKEIAFSDQDRHEVRFFNLKGKETKSIKTDRNPLTLLENEAHQKLFVISYSSKLMTTIDLKTKKKVCAFEIHPSAAGAMIIENKQELWVGGHGEGLETEEYIHIYDTETGKLKKKIHAPVMPVNFLKKESNLYVLSHGSSTLYKMNEKGDSLKSTEIGANPFEMMFMNGSLIVAGYDSNDIYIVDPNTLQIIKIIDVGKGPFQLIARERD